MRRTLALLALLVSFPVPATAQARVAPYLPVDPPVVERDPAGDAGVIEKRLARTDLTRREARAADWISVRYDLETRDGEPTARIAVQLRRLLPDRPRRHTQGVGVWFDEETFIDTDAHTGRSRFRSSSGGPGSTAPGCRRLDAEVTGRTVVQWIPTRCLLADSSEMLVDTSVWATDPSTDSGRRLVGTDGAPSNPAFVRWR